MARLNVEDYAFSDSRLDFFMALMGWNKRECLGALILIWHESQSIQTAEATTRQIQIWGLCPSHDRFVENLSEAGYISETETGKWRIHGNEDQIESLKSRNIKARGAIKARWSKEKKTTQEYSENTPSILQEYSELTPSISNTNTNTNTNPLNTLAENCVSASDEKPPEKKKPKAPKKEPKVKLGAAVFEVYKKHYCDRYGDCPPPGQVGYSMLKDVAEQFGIAQAQDLAIFYLTEYEDDYCAKQCHPINLFKSKRNDIWLKLKEKYDLDYTDLEANDGRVAETQQLDGQVLDPTGT